MYVLNKTLVLTETCKSLTLINQEFWLPLMRMLFSNRRMNMFYEQNLKINQQLLETIPV